MIPQPLELRHPLFGEFAQQMFSVSTEALRRCLEIQSSEGPLMLQIQLM